MKKYIIECELPNGEKFIKRTFKKQPAAIEYATELSVKYKKWVVRIFHREWENK